MMAGTDGNNPVQPPHTPAHRQDGAQQPLPTGKPRSRASRYARDKGFRAVCVCAACASVVALGWLLTSIFAAGLKHLDLDFLLSMPSRLPEKAGINSALAGTLFICTICALAALPLGVGTAIFLEEFKPKNTVAKAFHRFTALNIRNLAGVPSIVYGVVGITVFVYGFHLSVFQTGNGRPAISIGAEWYDEFVDTQYNYLSVAIDDPSTDPLELADGMQAINRETGETVTLKVVDPDTFEESETDPAGLVYDSETSQRVSEQQPWHVGFPFGRGVLAGGLTLALVVLPIIIISASEALRAVPDSLRHGALATGATRWQTASRMTLPAALPGIMTGAILAMSRAIGEAAPILLVAGGLLYAPFTPNNLMDRFTAMPLQVFDWANRPDAEFAKLAATGIIVLLVILLTFNAVAVFIRARFQKPLQ